MIRLTLAVIGVILIFCGYLSLVLSTISGIGYALYSFAHGVALALALWNGFSLFLLMLIGGGIVLLIGWALSYFKF